MNVSEWEQAVDWDAWITERKMHGDHVLVALDHVPAPFLIHPGCVLTDCDWHQRAIADGVRGIFVPVLDDDGKLTRPEHAAWEDVVADKRQPRGVRRGTR